MPKFCTSKSHKISAPTAAGGPMPDIGRRPEIFFIFNGLWSIRAVAKPAGGHAAAALSAADRRRNAANPAGLSQNPAPRPAREKIRKIFEFLAPIAAGRDETGRNGPVFC
jgi:hypothetical protein